MEENEQSVYLIELRDCGGMYYAWAKNDLVAFTPNPKLAKQYPLVMDDPHRLADMTSLRCIGFRLQTACYNPDIARVVAARREQETDGS